MSLHPDTELLYSMARKCEAEENFAGARLARRFYAEAHAAGHPFAAARLGHHHLEYIDVDPEPGNAYYWLAQALKVDVLPSDVRGCVENNLAVFVLQYFDTIKDEGEFHVTMSNDEIVDRAYSLFSSAAESGDATAAYNLGSMWRLEPFNLWVVLDPRDRRTSEEEWWAEAAKLGCPLAADNLEWLEVARMFDDLEGGDDGYELARGNVHCGFAYSSHELLCEDPDDLWRQV